MLPGIDKAEPQLDNQLDIRLHNADHDMGKQTISRYTHQGDIFRNRIYKNEPLVL